MSDIAVDPSFATPQTFERLSAAFERLRTIGAPADMPQPGLFCLGELEGTMVVIAPGAQIDGPALTIGLLHTEDMLEKPEALVGLWRVDLKVSEMRLFSRTILTLFTRTFDRDIPELLRNLPGGPDDRQAVLVFVGLKAVSRHGKAHGRHNLAGMVADGGRDAAQFLHSLLQIIGIPLHPHALKLILESFRRGNGVRGERGHPFAGENLQHLIPGPASQHHLTNAAAMCRQPVAHTGYGDLNGARTLQLVDVDHLAALQRRQVDGLAEPCDQRLHHGTRLGAEISRR